MGRSVFILGALAGALSVLTVAPARSAPPKPISLQVLSATAKDKVVDGAQVILQKDGFSSVAGTTDVSGRVTLTSPFGVDDASVTLLVSRDGYSPLVVQCPCAGLSYALSESLGQSLEAFRVVLNWGATPSDLDLHGVFPNNHIFFSAKDGRDADLDVDDTTSFGPETLTIAKRHAGENYVFAVHNFSANQQHGTSSLSTSGAKVFVYVGDSLVKSYYVPPSRPGALWVVFVVDGRGAIHDVNKVVDIAEAENVDRYLRQVSERTEFGTPVRAKTSDIQAARTLLADGQAAFEAGRLEDSIRPLERAIELDPNLSEAFVLLAKVHERLGRMPEAGWFARKAEEVRTVGGSGAFRIGNDRMTLTASSFLQAWKHYTFTPDNLLDDNLWSSWQPNRKPNGGVGQWIKLAFDVPHTVTGFEIFNGFRLIDDLGDLYAMNNRIKEAELEFSDGTKLPITFEDRPVQLNIALPEPKVNVSWVKLTVKSIYRGTRWNDLAMSEFHVMGFE